MEHGNHGNEPINFETSQYLQIMKKSLSKPGISRRHFLAAAGAAVALPTFIPLRALGGDDQAPAPSNRITVGVVGWGMQGPSNTAALLALPDCQVVAACDLDTKHLEEAVNKIN